MNDPKEPLFIAAIKEKLDESATDLPAEIVAKLDHARTSALAQKTGLPGEREFVQEAQRQLQESESLPDDIERRLNQMRRSALAQESKTSESFVHGLREKFRHLIAQYNINLAMMTTACLTLTVAAVFYGESSPPSSAPLDPELGLIASADELELYENLDFYLWLAENEDLN